MKFNKIVPVSTTVLGLVLGTGLMASAAVTSQTPIKTSHELNLTQEDLNFLNEDYSDIKEEPVTQEEKMDQKFMEALSKELGITVKELEEKINKAEDSIR